MSTLPLLSTSFDDGIAILTLANPPVNAIGAEARGAMWRAFDALERDGRVRGVVLAAAGEMFSGGGDLKEIGKADVGDAVGMTALAERLENFSKPVVAALHGRCIGGGALLTMACHGRVGAPSVSVMLPELNLGLVPGAGGTQRLPRLVGLETALDLVIRARAMKADEALRTGWLDEIAPNHAASAACRARRMAAGELPLRRTAGSSVGRLPAARLEALRGEYLELAQRCFPGRDAARAAIDLILMSTGDFSSGLDAERRMFADLAAGPQARALLHLFFAERALAKSPDAPDAIQREQIVRRLRAAGCGDGEPRTELAEAAQACLRDGLAARPEFVDAIAVKDCGYPALLGGPLHHAAQR